MGGSQGKPTPLEIMIKNFKKGFTGDYGVKMTAPMLRALCQSEWPTFGVEWPLEGTLDTDITRVVTGPRSP